MKILIVASSYSPNIGGIQTAVRQIARHFREAGHSVMIVTNRYPRRLPARDIIDGIAVVRLRFLLPRLQQLREARPDLYLAGVLFFPVTLFRLFFLVRRFAPDVVNLHYLGTPSLFVLTLHGLLHFHLVASLHGGDATAEPLKNRFNRWVFRALAGRAGAVSSCSGYLAGQAGGIAPEIGSKCVVIRNGVDTELFSQTPAHTQDRPYLFCVGRLELHKGFDTAIAAMHQVQDTYPSLELLIGGSGSQEKVFAEEAARCGLASRVKLLGRLDPKQIASYMRGSRAVIIPSRLESLGIVALEARVAMSTIIASNVGGLREALEGYPVLWVSPDNVDELRRAIVAVMSGCPADPPSPAGSEVLQTRVLSWSQPAELYLNLYREIQ